MSQKLYVGNLPFQSTEEEIAQFFTNYGTVNSVKIITDKETCQSRGFGFVEMDSIVKALSANGKEFGGRKLLVNEARERSR